MTIQRIASCIAMWLALAPSAPAFQSQSETPKAPPSTPASSTVVRSSSSGGVEFRHSQSRTESDGREIITESTQVPGPDGGLRFYSETTTETVRTGADSTQTRRNVYISDANGQRQLYVTTQADQQTLPDGSTRSVEQTWAPDLNGRLVLSARQTEETRPVGPNVIQTDTAIYLPGVNEVFPETERLRKIERRLSSDLIQIEASRSLRDGNGRWQTTETRNMEARTLGPSEHSDEETVHRMDANGTLSLSERKVTRQSAAGGQEQVVTETYVRKDEEQNRGGLGNQLGLNKRVRTTTTLMPNEGREIVQEIEARNPVAPNSPLQVVERIIETVRKVGSDRWEVERQTFGLDGNGRLVPIFREKGEAAGK